MKILIAVDDSLCSDRAVEFITRVRWPAGSRTIVCSALQPSAGVRAAANGFGAGAPEPDARPRRRLEALVSRAQCRLRDSGFPAEVRIVAGDAREVLIDVVKDERVDLLVVGSHGRTGLAKLMLGSVSSHLVTHAPCSVLVVKCVAT